MRDFLRSAPAAISGTVAARLQGGLDTGLLFSAAALLGLGLVMVASASVAIAEQQTGAPLHYFWKQLVYAFLGLCVAGVVFAAPTAIWEKTGFVLLTFALLLLVLVLIPHVGKEVNGARRWLDLGVFRLQASEPARLAVVVYLCGYIVRRQAELQHQFKGLIKPLLPVAAACGLLLLEPDFGAAAILLGVCLLMLFLGGARLLYLLFIGACAAAAFAWLATSQPYRLRRLLMYQDPWSDIENGGWQLAQSLIAIGRGEWTGVGLGSSVQKLLYLPEQHTDFIYAVYAEEFGLFGTAVLLALYALMVVRGFAIGREAERLNQRFRAYLAYGLSAWLGAQALINLAVNMGLVPTKGLTLPLMSYGGASLITVCVMLALILRVDHENRRDTEGRPTGARRAPRTDPVVHERAGTGAVRIEPSLGIAAPGAAVPAAAAAAAGDAA